MRDGTISNQSQGQSAADDRRAAVSIGSSERRFVIDCIPYEPARSADDIGEGDGAIFSQKMCNPVQRIGSVHGLTRTASVKESPARSILQSHIGIKERVG